jgi:streptogramin lyase
MDGTSMTSSLVGSRWWAASLGLCAALGVAACGTEGRADGSGEGITAGPGGLTNDDASAGTMAGTEPTVGGGTPGSTTMGADESADGTTIEPPKFDTATQPDGGQVGGCNCGGDLRWSYIWVANTNQSTVSKINTQTLVEEGRYYTEPGLAGSPSRTSVSLNADAVAVANRNGGVTKVWARAELCDPLRNGVPGVQTSSGAGDLLPFAQDDCIAWHNPFPAYTTQRPVAWTSGEQNPVTCEYEGAMVWTSGCNLGAGGNVWVHLLDGETGVSQGDVQVPGFACSGFGAYGGAVDSNNDFWISSNAAAPVIARIDFDDLSTELVPAPHWPYGIAVDSLDRVWLTANQASSGNHAAQRYDPATGTWEVSVGVGVQGYSGIQEGTDGRMWLNYGTFNGGGGMGLTWVDRDTLVVGAPIVIPGASGWLNGVSIDPNGNVWTVSPPANAVYRYDPTTGQLDSYTGLDFPYTYSDMTGSGLLNSTCGSPVG